MQPQPGILNRPPEHLAIASYVLVGDRTPERSRETIEGLREVVKNELRSNLDEFDASSSPDVAPAETGELGFEDGYDRQHLTITLGLGSGVLDALAIAVEERPADLRDIPWSQLADTPEVTTNGDLVLQACSDDPYVNEHVLRRVEEELGDRLSLSWVQSGAQRYTTREGRVSRGEARALIGFLDGTSNLDPRHSDEDARLVFVNPADVPGYPPRQPAAQQGGYPGTVPNFPPDLHDPPTHEPEWTRRGTYMVVRSSVIDTAAWDRETKQAQEQTIGRFKFSGASLDIGDDPVQLRTEPRFVSEPGNETVPLTAHVRKADPRTGPDDKPRRLFRRGYPLIDTELTVVKRGLVFIAFARTITTQFEFIQRAWITNPDFPRPGTGVDALRRFETVRCGGYFFVPAVRSVRRPWDWILPESA